MKLNLRSSLGTKIGSLTTIVAVAAILLLTFLSIYREKNNFKEDLVNRANLLLNTSAYSIRDSLYQQEIDELIDYARIVDEDLSVTLFVVYDAEGKKLVDSTFPAIISFSQSTDEQGLAILNKTEGIYQQWEPSQLVVGQPVTVGNQTIGALAIGLSTKQLDAKIAEITQQSILIAIAAIATGSLIGFWLIRRVTTPLVDLASVATAMSDGNLFTRVKNKSKDEIGYLAEAFNQMADAIQEREFELRKLANGLEQTVEIRTAELREKTEILEELAITDPLTKAFNRRYFFELAYKYMEQARQTNEPLSIILFDADNFKIINDTHGHQVGDNILIQLVRICQETIRKTDILARYGGEEFIILMPDADEKIAYAIAERLRKKTEKTIYPSKNYPVKLTISLGIARWGRSDMSLETLIANADKALYNSKNFGRNKTSTWSSRQTQHLSKGP